MVMLTTAAIVQNETLSDQGREDDEKAEDDDDTTTADEEDRLVSKQQQSPPPRLGDGCYHVFIDVGANIGVHGRFLYEPEKYPESWSAVQLFEQEYGTNRTNEDYCVFAIEANPSHWPRLETVAAAYRQHEHGWSYTVIPAGASDQNGTMTFYKQGGHDDRVNNEWGFSNVHDYRNQTAKVTNPSESIITVPAIRLSDWLHYHIFQRRIPEVPPSYIEEQQQHTTLSLPPSPPPKPKLGMKMDIEGSEYTVFPDLIHTGTACRFDFIFGEFHSMFGHVDPLDGHRIPLTSIKELQEYEWALKTVLQAARQCPVQWFSIDDESYLHDGQPLPGHDEETRQHGTIREDNGNNNTTDSDTERANRR